MKSDPLEDQIGPWLDSSKIDLLRLCPQKYYWRHELGLVSSGQLSTAISFGHAIHKALESIHFGDGFDKVTCPCSDRCNICQPLGTAEPRKIPKCVALFLLYYPYEHDDPNFPIDDHEVRTRDRGLQIIAEYYSKYRNDPFQVLAVEVPIKITLDKLTLIGRIDMVAKYPDGEIMPVDHKTTRYFGDNFIRGFKLSGQMTTYIYGLQQILGGEITKAMINAIRVTTKIDEESFNRWFTTRTPDDLERWKLDVKSAWEHIEYYRFTKFWPRHAPYACSAYNSTCEYYSLCTSGEQTQRDLIENAYEFKPWIPLGMGD